jgi:hypothetical protein
MRRLLLLAGALALSACSTATAPPVASTPAPAATSSPISTTPDQTDAIIAVASATAAVADAIGQAPPATLTRTTIDEKALHVAFATFDTALTIVDGFVASGVIVPGSAQALRLKAAILATNDALVAASAAQRAGSATSYSAALANAEIALDGIRAALKR